MQRHLADLPAINIKEAQQQDVLTHRRAQRREPWGQRAVGVYVHVCVHACEQASCQAWSLHCLLLSMKYAIWLPRLTSIIAMENPSSGTNGHCRQTGGGQLSQWHCLVWGEKAPFSPQIPLTVITRLQVGKPDPAFTHCVRSVKNLQHKLNDNCCHCSINVPAAAQKMALDSPGREDGARKLAVPQRTAPTTSPAEAGFLHATTLADLTLWSDLPQFDNTPAVPSRKLLSIRGKS